MSSDPRSEVLRRAGHREAADLLDALGALNAQPEAEGPEQEPEQPAAQDAREAEGRALLAQPQADVRRNDAGSVPFLSGPAQ